MSVINNDEEADHEVKGSEKVSLGFWPRGSARILATLATHGCRSELTATSVRETMASMSPSRPDGQSDTEFRGAVITLVDERRALATAERPPMPNAEAMATPAPVSETATQLMNREANDRARFEAACRMADRRIKDLQSAEKALARMKLMLNADLERRDFVQDAKTAGELHDAIWAEFELTRRDRIVRINTRLQAMTYDGVQTLTVLIEDFNELFAMNKLLGGVSHDELSKKMIIARSLKGAGLPEVLYRKMDTINNMWGPNSDESYDRYVNPTLLIQHDRYINAIKLIDNDLEWVNATKGVRKSNTKLVNYVSQSPRGEGERNYPRRRGRGRGQPYGRSDRGHNSLTSQCFECGGHGHFARNCVHNPFVASPHVPEAPQFVKDFQNSALGRSKNPNGYVSWSIRRQGKGHAGNDHEGSSGPNGI